MARPSIYDRISQKREAAEALARQQAEQQQVAVESLNEVAAPPPLLALDVQQNALKIAGLDLLMPQGFSFRDIDTTLEIAGCEVSFSACRRPAPQGLELTTAVERYVKKLREQHPETTIVREAEALLAGHCAISLDFLFSAGQERRHGRAVCTIIASADGSERQWLSLSTVIDPDQSRLADWLIAFDAMLAGMTA